MKHPCKVACTTYPSRNFSDEAENSPKVNTDENEQKMPDLWFNKHTEKKQAKGQATITMSGLHCLLPAVE